MDLDQLLHRHRTSLLRARKAASIEARFSHEGLAALYAERIALLRREADAPSA